MNIGWCSWKCKTQIRTLSPDTLHYTYTTIQWRSIKLFSEISFISLTVTRLMTRYLLFIRTQVFKSKVPTSSWKAIKRWMFYEKINFTAVAASECYFLSYITNEHFKGSCCNVVFHQPRLLNHTPLVSTSSTLF